MNANPESALEIKLVGLNLTTRKHYAADLIPLNFFDNLKDEVEVESLIVNGVDFEDLISGYGFTSSFLKTLNTLNEEESELDLPTILAVLKQKIIEPSEVFDFCANKIISKTNNGDELGLTDLREIVGDEYAELRLEELSEHLPKSLQEHLHCYYNREQYKADLFINELGFIKNGNTQIVYNRK